jgi:hypothetical protein
MCVKDIFMFKFFVEPIDKDAKKALDRLINCQCVVHYLPSLINQYIFDPLELRFKINYTGVTKKAF